MKRYIRDHRTLLAWSLSLMFFAAVLVSSLFVFYSPDEMPPLEVRAVAVMLVILSMLLVLANVFVFAWSSLRRMQLGFQRLGLITLSVAAAIALFSSFVRLEGEAWEYDWNWRGDGPPVEWLIERLILMLAYTAAAALTYVMVVSLLVWVVEGFRQPERD